MAYGLRAALARALMAIQPSVSRVAPNLAKYCEAFIAIHLAALVPPNGIRHCMSPEIRPPLGGGSRPVRIISVPVASQTVRKHSTCRHRPLATASIAVMTDPSWPDVSSVPLGQVGWIRNASSTAGMPPSEKPTAPANIAPG